MASRGLGQPSSLVSWGLSSAPSLSPSLSPFFLGFYTSDLLTPPHFSDTLLPLPSPTYLTPHLFLYPPSLHLTFPLHPPAHISLPPRWPVPLALSSHSPLPSQSYESAINTPAKDLEGIRAPGTPHPKLPPLPQGSGIPFQPRLSTRIRVGRDRWWRWGGTDAVCSTTRGGAGC